MVPRVTRDVFNDLPQCVKTVHSIVWFCHVFVCCYSNCLDGCSAEEDNEFVCTLRQSYKQLLENQGVIVKKYWKVGHVVSQNITTWKADNSEVVKKYIVFSSDGSKLTIKVS